jgi:hypothetical protein
MSDGRPFGPPTSRGLLEGSSYQDIFFDACDHQSAKDSSGGVLPVGNDAGTI